MGSTVDQDTLSVEYCNVEPAGQLEGTAVVVPPDFIPPKVVQTLLIIDGDTGVTSIRFGQQPVAKSFMLSIHIFGREPEAPAAHAVPPVFPL